MIEKNIYNSFTTRSNMLKFEDYLTLEQYQKIDTILSHENHHKKALSSFYQILYLFLKDLQQNDSLKPIQYGDSHQTDFSIAWNSFFKDKPSKAELELRQIYIPLLFHHFFYFKMSNHSEEIDVNDKYQLLIDKVNSGNFAFFEFQGVNKCHHCGEIFCVTMDKWQPQFLETTTIELKEGEAMPSNARMSARSFAKDSQGRKFVNIDSPATSCAAKPVMTLQVEFQTGHLLVSDWFMIDEFNNIVDAHNHFDYGTELGRMNASSMYAKEFNFISTSSFSEQANIFQKNNQLIVIDFDGYSIEKQEKLIDKHLADYIHHDTINDHHRITIIEKEHLIDLLMTHGKTKEDASQTVEDYLNDNEVKQIQVEPGQYQFTFAGTPKNLNQHLPKDEQTQVALHPIFVMKKSSPTLTYQRKNKP